MGNAKAKLEDARDSSSSATERIDGRAKQVFVKLTGSSSNSLTFAILKEFFSAGFAESLWSYLSDSKPFDGELSLAEFSRRAPSLWGTSTDVYVKACSPVFHLIRLCSEAAGARAVAGDEEFIGNLAHEMCGKGSSVEEIISWKCTECPSFCNALRDLVLSVFFDYEYNRTEYSSDIVSPMQMWYLQCCLPVSFFPKNAQSKDGSQKETINSSWSLLYSSAVHGISVNRFENNVFDYRGPTVSVFQLTDKSIFVLVTEETWRHSATRFGGSAQLFEMSPGLKRFSSFSPIYCNFKIRSAAFGISFAERMKIDKEMSNVFAVEVWGCAPTDALLDQQKLRAWQSKQAEKNKKVPLPGNWDDNPDKTILEMAGFEFSNERK